MENTYAFHDTGKKKHHKAKQKIIYGLCRIHDHEFSDPQPTYLEYFIS
jgi:hypothetical protein